MCWQTEEVGNRRNQGDGQTIGRKTGQTGPGQRPAIWDPDGGLAVGTGLYPGRFPLNLQEKMQGAHTSISWVDSTLAGAAAGPAQVEPNPCPHCLRFADRN